MKVRNPKARSFRTKLALGVGILFLLMLALAIGVQNLSLNSAFNYQIKVVHGVKADSIPDLPPNPVHHEPIKNKNIVCQGHGCPQMTIPGINDVSPNTEQGLNAGVTLSGEAQLVKDSVTTWMWYSSLTVFALCGLLALILIWKLTGSMVGQLDSISKQAANLNLNHPGERIVIDNPHYEISSMAETLNDMIERMEESNRAQKAFVRNASHELRTPITTIGASLESLSSQGRISPDAEPTIRRAIEANRKSADLITSLLELSRIQSTEQTHNQPVDIRLLVIKILRSYQEEIERQSLTIDIHDLGSVEVITDPKYAEIALDNLIRNAIIHNYYHGTIVVDCEKPDGDSEKTVSIRIINSTEEREPEGLTDPKDLTKCFYRGQSTRIANKPGHGLGLSIVEEISASLGIGFSLRYSGESTFEVCLTFPVSK